ncbi:Uncharacterized mitochondrial protein AtMg00810 [Striga hermonthica]|uniref:Uncharacterized mitochondrial protein AtMg00810 n=1 Tax=Striga hermonthica TaxID=68872 RepID=A0A9N7R709_STRHE|nr:Uncharacterized mitochondrial protein AtMg00810 [Striga hermonthica]
MLEIGYSRCNADHCCYVKRFGNSFIILLLYVDDMLIAGSDVKEIERLKDQLSRRFDMKDLGEAKQILGMKITRDRNAGKLWLSQSDYIEKVLCRFNMNIAKLVRVPLGSQFKLSNKDSPQDNSEKEKMRVTPYASAIGSLMYAMVCTRPDIAHAVGVVSRFMSNPGVMHWEAVKWILRYLRGTKDRALVFVRSTLTLSGFVDVDFAVSDLDKRRSTTGYVFTYDGTAVSWISKLQKIVTLSTTEADTLFSLPSVSFCSVEDKTLRNCPYCTLLYSIEGEIRRELFLLQSREVGFSDFSISSSRFLLLNEPGGTGHVARARPLAEAECRAAELIKR